MTQRVFLGEFEEIVLLAVARLALNAYGVSVWQTVEENSQRTVSIGSIYATLERLEQKGFISSRQGESTPERGGRAKRYFRIEAPGDQALNEAQAIRQRLTGGLPNCPLIAMYELSVIGGHA
ncbi:MAG: PadR family transcriptional regulator [Capsulimonas sp.]|uniref:PadR family transcriptional regulator n=1 Tax=Capsulimonas sp. TaxID=2494211 RepID=UPI003264C0F7